MADIWDTQKTFVAFWGAITGTAAIFIQGYNWLSDRPHLQLTGQVRWRNDLRNDVSGYEITIEAVNHGRRIIVIKDAGMASVAVRGLFTRRYIKPYQSISIFQCANGIDANTKGDPIPLPEGSTQKWCNILEASSVQPFVGRKWFLYVKDTYGKTHKLTLKTDIGKLDPGV